MHEVKVYDSSGKLKKVISSQALDIRSKQQMETPSMFRRNKNDRIKHNSKGSIAGIN